MCSPDNYAQPLVPRKADPLAPSQLGLGTTREGDTLRKSALSPHHLWTVWVSSSSVSVPWVSINLQLGLLNNSLFQAFPHGPSNSKSWRVLSFIFHPTLALLFHGSSSKKTGPSLPVGPGCGSCGPAGFSPSSQPDPSHRGCPAKAPWLLKLVFRCRTVCISSKTCLKHPLVDIEGKTFSF